MSNKSAIFLSPFKCWQRLQQMAVCIGLAVLAFGGAGCQTTTRNLPEVAVAPADSLVLREGDAVRISFPGAPNLNTDQTIRRDGRITLPSVGEFKAVDLTPGELEKELVKLYGPQLQVKEVNVAVVSSVFFVYVTGAVQRPGKVVSDRPMNVLEAVLEAGGFNYDKASLKDVTVLRREKGQSRRYVVNMKRVLQGVDASPMKLEPSDIIFVAERFTWF